MRTRRHLTAAAVLTVATCLPTARAVVTTDGSLGPRGSFSGSNVTLPASLGRQKGGNLFHSFDQFDVPDGGSVTFAGPASVKNVVARVTGGQVSHIDGTLGSSIAGANLYLINPAGIRFGFNAALNVSGTFTATTADVVRLVDGKTFAVDRAGDGVLTGANPAAFGFLGARPGSITLDNSILVTSGANIRLAGGAVTLTDGSAVATPAGHLSVAAVRSGDLNIDPTLGDLIPAAGAVGGAVTLNQAELVTDGTGGGRIDLHASSLSMTNSIISAQTLGTHAGGGISVGLSGLLDADASTLTTANSGTGRAGNVDVTAGPVRLADGGTITAKTYDVGPAGAVTLRAASLSIGGTDANDNNASISTDSISAGHGGPAGAVNVNVSGDVRLSNDGSISADTNGLGAGGRVTIAAHRLTLDGAAGDIGTFISADSLSVAAGGAAGRVDIRAGRVSVLNSALISSDTDGQGRGGAVSIRTHNLTVSGTSDTDEGSFISSSTNSPDNGGAAGGVSIVADQVHLIDGGNISSDTLGAGAAGTVAVKANILEIIQGGGDLLTGISSSTEGGTGRAGDVQVAAGTLNVLDGGEIRTDTAGPGTAGTIFVNADTVRVDGGVRNALTAIRSQAVEDSGGDAGNVAVTAKTLTLTRGGEIGSDTSGTGAAGVVDVRATTATIDGNAVADPYTGISSQSNAAATGRAGDVSVIVGSAAIRNGGDVTSTTHGTAPAGTTTVTAGSITIDGSGSDQFFTGLGSQSDGTGFGRHAGPAGNVKVAADRVTLLNGGEIDSDTFAGGHGGVVTANIGTLRIDGGGFDTLFTGIGANANGGSTGDAGSVFVTAGRMTLVDDGQISSSTGGAGSGGPVTVHSGPITIDGFEHANSFTGIVSQSNSTGDGHAGSVSVTASAIDLVRGAEISSGTFSAGDAGSVTVHADSIHADATGKMTLFTGIDSQSNYGAAGRAGDVAVTAGQIGLFNGGTITSDTFGAGAAGTVNVRAGSISISSGGEAFFFTGISSRSGNGDTGPAGDVNVVADKIHIFNGGAISSDTFGPNHAGTVVVKAGAILVDGAGNPDLLTAINSEAKPGVGGAAGNVRVKAGVIELIDCGYISSDSGGAGNAGTVRVQAGTLNVDGFGRFEDFTGVGSQAFATGRAGSVAIDVNAINVADGGSVQATSLTAAAGDVFVHATGDVRGDGATFSTQSFQNDGGNVTLSTGRQIDLSGGSLVSAQAKRDGGNVTLNAGRRITIDHSDVTAQAGLNGARLTLDPLLITLNHSTLNGLANGVPVRVTVDPSAVLIRSNDSQILANNPTLPPDVDLTGAILHFVVPTFGGQTVLAEGCEMQLRKKNLSSFVGQERLGLPPVPGQGVMSGVTPAR